MPRRRALRLTHSHALSLGDPDGRDGRAGRVSAVFFGIAVLAPALRERYDLSLTQVGVLLASVSIGATISVLPWGLLADRVGERAVIATGLAAAGAALIASGRAGSFEALVVLLIAAGLFGASVNAASGRAIMHWFGAEQRASRWACDRPRRGRRRGGGCGCVPRRGRGRHGLGACPCSGSGVARRPRSAERCWRKGASGA